MHSNHKLADVSIPVTFTGQEEIQSSGASRLGEILSGQTGLEYFEQQIFDPTGFKKEKTGYNII